MTTSLPWWQQGVIYQLLVPSFLDTDGDGRGDLGGILDRLDYLQWLGVKALWLSPIHPSPLADLGYDVSDYLDIHPAFGSLAQFDELLSEVHARDMKLILDWVPNHTSDEHPWFVESRSSRDNGKRDWYIWRDANPDGSPPNNWLSVFGGSAWEWDATTGQYYYHTFLEKQPDLNWRNPDVRAAMLDALRFWLNRGVDGFRIDALCLMIEDEHFRDNPPNPKYNPETDAPDQQVLPTFTRDQPGVHDIVREIRRIADTFGDRLLAGEMYLPLEKVVTYYGSGCDELHLPFNLRMAWIEWNTEVVADLVQTYRDLVPEGCWPTWTLSTHDCLRVAFRLDGEQPRVAALLLLTLPGTPTLYYGEEIGMRGVPIDRDHASDPQGRRIGRNRDPERTPMQWANEPNGGFTTGQPWLPIGDDLPTANVASQSQDPHSLLSLYRRLIALRQSEPALLEGGFELVSRQTPLLSYRRIAPDRRLLVILNMGHEEQSYILDESGKGRILLSTFLDREGEPIEGTLRLRGDEGVVVILAKD